MANSAVLTFSHSPEKFTGAAALHLEWSGDPRKVGVILRIAQEFIPTKRLSSTRLSILRNLLNDAYFTDENFKRDLHHSDYTYAATLCYLDVDNCASEMDWTKTDNGIYILRPNWEAECQAVLLSGGTLETRKAYAQLKRFRENLSPDCAFLYQRVRQSLLDKSHKSLFTQPTVGVSLEQSKAILTDRYGDVW
ncbi:hypothetical protein [Ferrovum sp.]|uniref:hypothetical protein n=1 Tax=Ferrovum sp. TaxID=2609467 RepID=UPI002606089C|nr:hypothetical protein [Ferrovum sp.]